MGLVIAIDPGRHHGKTLDRLMHDLSDHEVVVVSSCGEAVDLLETRLPDLLVFPLICAPADEMRLQARLRDLARSGDIRSLTIPLAVCAEGEKGIERPTAVPARWFYWLRPATIDGVEPDSAQAFAWRVRAELQHPTPLPPPVPLPVPQPEEVFDPQSEADEIRAASSPARWRLPLAPPESLAPDMTPSSVETIVIDAITGTSHAPAHAAPMHAERADPADARPDVDVWSQPETDRSAPESYRPLVPPVQARVDDPLGRLVALLSRAPKKVAFAASALVVLLMLGVSGRSLASFPARLFQARASSPETGVADLRSVPDGAQVFVGGREIGVTPLRTALAAGEHTVEFRYQGSAQTVRLTVVPGGTVAQRIEWKGQRATGSLKVETQPPGAAVFIDGVSSGTTPLVVEDVAVGSHDVELRLGDNSVRQTVEVRAGRTTTLDSGVYVGWLALFSPIELTVRERGRTLALDERNRVMLSAGPHELTLENRALGFRAVRTVHIESGETTAESLEMPKTQLTITASDQADVWIDGARAGGTPLVDWPVDIGTREVIVRAAGRPERKLTVTATVQPVHLSVELP
jgi:hypothetical protein